MPQKEQCFMALEGLTDFGLAEEGFPGRMRGCQGGICVGGDYVGECGREFLKKHNFFNLALPFLGYTLSRLLFYFSLLQYRG